MVYHADKPLYIKLIFLFLNINNYIFSPYTYCDNVVCTHCQLEWIEERGFRGWMVWAIDLDDFTGLHCNAGPYPLLSALNAGMNDSHVTQSMNVVTAHRYALIVKYFNVIDVNSKYKLNKMHSERAKRSTP